MNEVSFVKQREEEWKRLSYLSDRADFSPGNLSSKELREFFTLYRKCSSDLAMVRTRSNNAQLIDFLNELLGRAYSTLYRTRPRRLGPVLAEALVTVPRTVRRLRYFVLASFLTFAIGLIFAFVACKYNADTRQVIEPPAMHELFERWKSGKMEDRGFSGSILYTGFYASHNQFVSVVQAAVGAATMGVGTAQALWMNGLILGALTYEMSTVHRVPYLFIRILPHGVTEMSGLIIAGAAGYVMGWALISPGRRKRGAALRHASKDALVLLCTGAMMMYIAAPVEGFFSFNPRIPDFIKIIFASCAAIAWGIFWLGYGRTPEEAQVALSDS